MSEAQDPVCRHLSIKAFCETCIRDAVRAVEDGLDDERESEGDVARLHAYRLAAVHALRAVELTSCASVIEDAARPAGEILAALVAGREVPRAPAARSRIALDALHQLHAEEIAQGVWPEQAASGPDLGLPGDDGGSRLFKPTKEQRYRSPLLAAAAELQWTEEEVIAELLKAHEHLRRSLMRIGETTSFPWRFVVPPGLTPENAHAVRGHLNSMTGAEAMCLAGLIHPPDGSYGVEIELEPHVRGGAWLRFAPGGYLAPHLHEGADERCAFVVEGEVSFKSSPSGDSWKQLRGGVGHAKALDSFSFLGGFRHAIRAGEAGALVLCTLALPPRSARCDACDPSFDCFDGSAPCSKPPSEGAA